MPSGWTIDCGLLGAWVVVATVVGWVVVATVVGSVLLSGCWRGRGGLDRSGCSRQGGGRVCRRFLSRQQRRHGDNDQDDDNDQCRADANDKRQAGVAGLLRLYRLLRGLWLLQVAGVVQMV